MKNFIINEDQVKGILVYLGKKPFDEVVQGVQMLSTLPEHKEIPIIEEKKHKNG